MCMYVCVWICIHVYLYIKSVSEWRYKQRAQGKQWLTYLIYYLKVSPRLWKHQWVSWHRTCHHLWGFLLIKPLFKHWLTLQPFHELWYVNTPWYIPKHNSHYNQFVELGNEQNILNISLLKIDKYTPLLSL